MPTRKSRKNRTALTPQQKQAQHALFCQEAAVPQTLSANPYDDEVLPVDPKSDLAKAPAESTQDARTLPMHIFSDDPRKIVDIFERDPRIVKGKALESLKRDHGIEWNDTIGFDIHTQNMFYFVAAMLSAKQQDAPGYLMSMRQRIYAMSENLRAYVTMKKKSEPVKPKDVDLRTVEADENMKLLLAGVNKGKWMYAAPTYWNHAKSPILFRSGGPPVMLISRVHEGKYQLGVHFHPLWIYRRTGRKSRFGRIMLFATLPWAEEVGCDVAKLNSDPHFDKLSLEDRQQKGREWADAIYQSSYCLRILVTGVAADFLGIEGGFRSPDAARHQRRWGSTEDLYMEMLKLADAKLKDEEGSMELIEKYLDAEKARSNALKQAMELAKREEEERNKGTRKMGRNERRRRAKENRKTTEEKMHDALVKDLADMGLGR